MLVHRGKNQHRRLHLFRGFSNDFTSTLIQFLVGTSPAPIDTFAAAPAANYIDYDGQPESRPIQGWHRRSTGLR